MTKVRRAFFAATGERYVVLVVNLVMLATISRVLPAQEIGIALIGISVLTIAGTVRDFGLTAFIVQREVVSQESVRSAFTVTLMILTVLAGAMIAAHDVVTAFYRDETLGTFLQIAACSLILGTPFGPSGALLQREMDFRTLALINISGAVVNGVVAVTLAMNGGGALSIAWAAVAQSAVVSTLALLSKPVLWAFQPCLKDWREFIMFGSSASLYVLLGRLYENLPYLVLGRLLPVSNVALFNRATMVCDLPLKGLLSGIFPVALPALADAARDGQSLAQSYLRALSYITAVQWPGLILVALLAHPMVTVVLGPKWYDVVPLVQIMSIGSMLSSPNLLVYPILVSAGAVNLALFVNMSTLPVCATIFVLAASHGVKAAALSLLLTVPLQSAVGLLVVRKRAFFAWSELVNALRNSAVVTLCTMIGPVVVLFAGGLQTNMSVPVGFIAGFLGAAGWVVGIFWSGHPLREHIRDLMQRRPEMPSIRRSVRRDAGTRP